LGDFLKVGRKVRVVHFRAMPHLHRACRSTRRRSRGQSLAEFALVLPVFLLVLTGIIDFGLLLYSRMTVINATREGARAAVTQIKDPLGIPAIVQNAVVGADTGLGLTTGSVTVVCVAGTDADGNAQGPCDFVTGGQPDPLAGDYVRVTTSYVYHSIFASFFGSTINVSSTVQMVIEPQ